MYFLRGSLPWQGLHVHKGEDRYKKILAKKSSTTAKELCKGFPEEFAEYIEYTRKLEFEADPDYIYLRNLLVSALEKQNTKFDFWYDWVKEKPNIVDQIAVERYINNNTNISLEIKGDDKKEKEGETKNTQNENENNLSQSKYNTLITSISTNDTNNQYSSQVQTSNNAGINMPVNNSITSDNIGNNTESNSKKDNKKNKKKDKKEKSRNCLIW